MLHKAGPSIEEVPYCFSRSFMEFHSHTGGKNWWFESNLRLLGRSQLSNPSDLPCYFSWKRLQWMMTFHLHYIHTSSMKIDKYIAWHAQAAASSCISRNSRSWRQAWFLWQKCLLHVGKNHDNDFGTMNNFLILEEHPCETNPSACKNHFIAILHQ